MPPVHADILILGAGPAGSTLAALVPEHFSVILADGRDLAAPPPEPGEKRPGSMGEKPCGGLLAPGAQKQIFSLGLSLPPEVLCGPQLFGVLAHDLGAGLTRACQRHYLNIRRPLFDRMLFARAAGRPNVTAVLGKRAVRIVQEKDGAAVFLDDGARLFARLLVGADGAGSIVRQTLDDPPQAAPPRGFPASFGAPCRLLAMQRVFRTKTAPAAFEVFFHPELTDFYAWSIPKDDTLVVGLAAPWRMPDPRGRMDRLCDHLLRLGRHAGEVLAEESCALLRPGLTDGVLPGRGRTALIGEAGGFISPSSAEGVSFALKTAQILARALADHPNLDTAPRRELSAVAAHRRACLPVILNLAAKWAKFAGMYTPWARLAAMRLSPRRLPRGCRSAGILD